MDEKDQLILFYRQKLADEQWLTANLTVKLDNLGNQMKSLEEKLDVYNVSEENEATRNKTKNS
jgi:hypothetical protein